MPVGFRAFASPTILIDVVPRDVEHWMVLYARVASQRSAAGILSDPDAKVIVVEHSDRLARFGVAHLQAALAEQGLRIVVADDSETTDDLVRAVTATKQPDPVEATG